MRWLIVIVGVAVAVGLFLILRPTDDEPTSATPTPSQTESTTPSESPTETAEPSPTTTGAPDAVEIEVEEGRVQGPSRIQVALGDRVAIEVKSDVADEVHVHTYDIIQEVSPEEDALITFRADIPGIFEIELEAAGLELTRLEVNA